MPHLWSLFIFMNLSQWCKPKFYWAVRRGFSIHYQLFTQHHLSLAPQPHPPSTLLLSYIYIYIWIYIYVVADAINFSLRLLKYVNISSRSGSFPLIMGSSLKLLVQACKRGKLLASISLTPRYYFFHDFKPGR